MFRHLIEEVRLVVERGPVSWKNKRAKVAVKRSKRDERKAAKKEYWRSQGASWNRKTGDSLIGRASQARATGSHPSRFAPDWSERSGD